MKCLTRPRTVSILSLALLIVFIAAGTNAHAEIIASFPLNTNPGWNVQGQWAYGVPQGGGSYCLDPSFGHTDTNVYGYNLAGDYPNNMQAYYLTSTAINCYYYENVELRFWRWLGVESSSYDHASVEVSNDGTSWTTVWSHAGASFCDGGWIECTYDISSIADNQATVYIRWAMGTTDSSVTYPGWNIDDISLHGDATVCFGIGIVNFEDYAVVAGSWLDTCSEPNWCEGVDMDRSGTVDYNDIEFLTNNWLRAYYLLSASVLGGNGTVSPSSEIYIDGTVAGLTATPSPYYGVQAWTGTDNDSSRSTTNAVTMNSNKNVTVAFEYVGVFPNGGFEMGDFTYWTISGDVSIYDGLTEGVYSAVIVGNLGLSSTLSRTVNLPSYGNYTISFDYACAANSGSVYVLINGLQYPLTTDEDIHTFTQDFMGINSFNIQFFTSEDAYLLLDNCIVTDCLYCQNCNYNGICDFWEGMDCPDCQPGCNFNGYCDPWEEGMDCPDCQMGCNFNGYCDPWEYGTGCPDCSVCGDGWCDPGEEGWCSDCP